MSGGIIGLIRFFMLFGFSPRLMGFLWRMFPGFWERMRLGIGFSRIFMIGAIPG